MNLDFLMLGGYGLFVWPAFIFTFFSCFILYQKTIKKFHKYEKIFTNNYKQIKIIKIEGKKEKGVFSRSPIF